MQSSCLRSVWLVIWRQALLLISSSLLWNSQSFVQCGLARVANPISAWQPCDGTWILPPLEAKLHCLRVNLATGLQLRGAGLNGA